MQGSSPGTAPPHSISKQRNINEFCAKYSFHHTRQLHFSGKKMLERGQDPMTETLLARSGNDCSNISQSNLPPLVESLQVTAMPEIQAPYSRSQSKSFCTGCAEGAQIRKKLEHENAQLKLQIKQQFHDLGQLDKVLNHLEKQVGGHEAVIKEQSLRIQEQEEIILQLNTRMQQHLAALIINAYKTRF